MAATEGKDRASTDTLVCAVPATSQSHFLGRVSQNVLVLQLQLPQTPSATLHQCPTMMPPNSEPHCLH